MFSRNTFFFSSDGVDGCQYVMAAESFPSFAICLRYRTIFLCP
jgi:hypothetical protein